ncbi:hypothetical protein V1511DRAFT_110817 [Dipodascopsis uninucleata]
MDLKEKRPESRENSIEESNGVEMNTPLDADGDDQSGASMEAVEITNEDDTEATKKLGEDADRSTGKASSAHAPIVDAAAAASAALAAAAVMDDARRARAGSIGDTCRPGSPKKFSTIASAMNDSLSEADKTTGSAAAASALYSKSYSLKAQTDSSIEQSSRHKTRIVNASAVSAAASASATATTTISSAKPRVISGSSRLSELAKPTAASLMKINKSSKLNTTTTATMSTATSDTSPRKSLPPSMSSTASYGARSAAENSRRSLASSTTSVNSPKREGTRFFASKVAQERNTGGSVFDRLSSSRKSVRVSSAPSATKMNGMTSIREKVTINPLKSAVRTSSNLIVNDSIISPSATEIESSINDASSSKKDGKLTSQIATQQARIEELERELRSTNQKSSEIKDLKDKLDRAERELDANAVVMQTLQDELKNAISAKEEEKQKQIEELVQNMTMKETKIQGLESQISDVLAINENLQEKVSKLESSNKDLAYAVEQMKNSLLEATAAMQELGESNAQLQISATQSKAELDSVRQTYKDFEDNIDMINEELQKSNEATL